MAVLPLLYVLCITGIALRNLLLDGVKVYPICFTVCNVVKQGGILSPHLFNVYMDDLSVILNKFQIGCIYAGNNPMYADDLCIFSHSVSGLRKHTNCCEKYGDIFNITYNVNKSYCMVIDNKPQNMKNTRE